MLTLSPIHTLFPILTEPFDVSFLSNGANFNVRKDKYGNYVTEGDQVCIDAGDNYDSECAECFIEHVLGMDMSNKAYLTKVRKK